MLRRPASFAIAVAVALMLPTMASAGGAINQKLLWATINACGPTDQPTAIGIRASMPGDGVAAQKMYVDLLIQFQLPNGRWRAVPSAGDSGFISLGSAKTTQRQAGQTFQVTPKPGQATPTVVRGVAVFQWRLANGTVVHTARKLTTAGRVSSAGADPAGYSAASCTLQPVARRR